jgi:uncharacterized membrane protein
MSAQDALSSEVRKTLLRRLVTAFFWACMVGFPLMLVLIVLNTIVPFLGESIATKAVVAKFTFVNLTLYLGVFQLFLGVMLALIGVTINYEIDASAGSARLRLISASPGILLVLLANVLFVLASHQQITATEAFGENTTAAPISFSGMQTSIIPRDNGKVPDDIKGP